MDPLTILALLGTGTQLAGSLYDAFSKKKIPDWFQEEFDAAQLLANEGLTSSQLNELRTAYTPGVSRGLSERRDRIASLNANRGRTGSSAGNEQILSVPTTEETITPILAEADLSAMAQGRQMLQGLTGARMGLDYQNDEIANQGLAGIGESLSDIHGVLKKPDTSLQDTFMNFLNNSGGGTDLMNLSDSELLWIFQNYFGEGLDTSLPPWQQQSLGMP